MYVVIDIESTGGAIRDEAIIEIALFKLEQGEVTDQLISLIHTQKPIQPFVQNMTGITPSMLRSAPRFHELAKRIVQMTEGCVMIGHGVAFDYRILKLEFERLGYEYERSTIDTVNWSRKLLPGMESYKLSSLCEALGIWLPRKHRAGDDARATVDLFKLLLEKDREKRISALGSQGDAVEAPPPRLQKMLEGLKDDTGVYYLRDASGALLKAGSADKLHKELRRLFLSPEAADVALQQKVASVEVERTGNRTVAALKLHAERTACSDPSIYPPLGRGVVLRTDDSGTRLLLVKHAEPQPGDLAYVSNVRDAQRLLNLWTVHFEACPTQNALAVDPAKCSLCAAGHASAACSEAGRDASVFESMRPKWSSIRLENRAFSIDLPQGRAPGEKVRLHCAGGQTGYAFYKLHDEVDDSDRLEMRVTQCASDAVTRGLLWLSLLQTGRKGAELRAWVQGEE